MMLLAMKTLNVIAAFWSIVTGKQSFIVSQIVGCPVLLLWLRYPDDNAQPTY